MDLIQILAYIGFLSGAVIMISVHNMIVSLLLLKGRSINASNLKVIFNFGQIVRSAGIFGLYITPKVATIFQCTILQYLLMAGDIIARSSLIAFLLWRLKQTNKKDVTDKWICIILFTVRTALMAPYLIFQKISTHYYPGSDRIICNIEDMNLIFGICGVIVDVIIDVYVTVRFIPTLKKFKNANKNVAQSNSNFESKKTLFKLVVYLNLLRLLVSFIFHTVGSLDTLHITINKELSITIKCITYIILSYVITVDAEVFNVIEGKDQKSTKNENFIQFTRGPPPDYASSDSSFGEDQSQYDQSQYDQSQYDQSQYDHDEIILALDEKKYPPKDDDDNNNSTLTKNSNMDIV